MLLLRSAAVLSVIFFGQLFAQPEGFYLIDGDASPPVIDSTGCYVVKVGKSATIHWDSFSINENETFRFEQENSESSVINFVTGESQSVICGNLQSNGKVYLNHPSEMFVGSTGNLRAPNIFLVTEQGKIEVNGSLTANNPSGKGGKIHVLGKDVEIQGSAVIDASAAAGEGEVLIGGSFQGKDRSIPHSERTVVHPGAQISVDALEFGNGGRVIIWSDENTYFHGHVNARGGKEGGDGGFVEVSGKEQLGFDGTVNIEAPKGQAGELLLDPSTVYIEDTGLPISPDNGSNLSQPYGNLSSYTGVSIGSILTALNSGDVTIQARFQIVFRLKQAEYGGNQMAANTLTLTASTNILTRSPPSGFNRWVLNLGPVNFTANVNVGSTAEEVYPQGRNGCTIDLSGAKITTTTGQIKAGNFVGVAQPAMGITTSQLVNVFSTTSGTITIVDENGIVQRGSTPLNNGELPAR